MRVVRPAATWASMTLKAAAGGKRVRFTHGEDFLIGRRIARDVCPQGAQGRVRVRVAAPAVFVGYGVVDPKNRHDDYAKTDVDGKIAVMFGGAPPRFPPDERAYLASEAVKIRTAAARGAVGVLFLRPPAREKALSWARFAARRSGPAMSWTAPEAADRVAATEDAAIGKGEAGVQLAATLSRAGAEKLFAGTKMPFAALFATLEAGDAPPAAFSLEKTVSLKARYRVETLKSANVVGLIEGADPALRDEALVVSAHLDHVGVKNPRGRAALHGAAPARRAAPSNEDADLIYNGALDNALGVAVMLETARRFTAEGRRPRRTVVFLATTAEEKGMIGADYFARFPPLGGKRIVANLNLDMPLALYPFKDVIAFGAERSSLIGPVREAAARLDVDVSPDPAPEQGLFVRSDHLRFVEQGAPSLFLFLGFQNGGRAIFEAFMRDHYHRPSDDLNQPIDYGSAARFATLNYLVVLSVADAATAPAWKEGDFFGALAP